MILTSLALTLAAAQVSQGGVVIPNAGRVPELLRVLDLRKESDFARRCLAASAQGLYNADAKRWDKLYLLWDDADAFWAKYLVQKKLVRDSVPLKSLRELVERTGQRGAVLYDSKPSHLTDIATTVAGCESLLMVGDPKLIEELGLKTVEDLRGKFKTNVEAYQWLEAKFGDKVNAKISSITVPNRTSEHNPSQLRDYLVANKVFTFWVSGSKEAKLAGVDSKAEAAEVAGFLQKHIEPNTPVFGYPWSGDGVGLGEWDGIAFLSQNAHYLVPTDNFGNLSVWTLFPPSVQHLMQSHLVMPVKPAKRYCTIMLSDGDNACTFREFFPNYWSGLKSKSFPVGWTMGPLLRKIAPPIYDYAMENLPTGDTLGSGVSGVGYAAMEHYGKALPEPDKQVSAFMQQTSNECREAGDQWLWIMRYGKPGSPSLSAYAQSGTWRIILGGYGQVTDNMAESLGKVGATPVVHSVLDAWSPPDFSTKLKKFLARKDCPKVFSVFILNWNFKPSDLQEVAKELRKADVEILSPERLGDVLRQLQP